MTIKINPDRLLALLGDNGEHWVQGAWGDGEQMCLHAAIHRCSPQPGDAFIIEQVATNQGWGTAWNDHEDTDWAMVRERIIGGIEVSDPMLADTFGPQWVHLVALVRRAVVLTRDEAQRLVAAQAAVFDAVAAISTDKRIAACNAAGRAAFDAVDNAKTADWVAWNSVEMPDDDWCKAVDAWDSAWDAADAVVKAALALAIRDLIGQDGLTQTLYDTLTRPWASVIGPVHPDDEATF